MRRAVREHAGRDERPRSKALAMGPVDLMNLVDILRCRQAAASDLSIGALSPKHANALFRQLGQRVREIRRRAGNPRL